MKILMVLTSHDQLGATRKKTGLWLEEFAAPYYVFRDAGAEIALASPKGGKPPIDPRSLEPSAQTPATERLKHDEGAQARLADTAKLSTMTAGGYDAVFYPGGHGPLWDLAEDRDSIRLIEAMFAAGKIVAAVCHGPAALRHAKAPGGAYLVQGRPVTGFANSEEAAGGLTQVVPFLVEDMLRQNGGRYSQAADFQSHVVVDGNLITGQNPASAQGCGEAVVSLLQR